jgi:hypothetical protein
MIRYGELKNKILHDMPELERDDFYLLEGKLIFKEKNKAIIVKKFLQDSELFEDVIITPATNHPHWDSEYEAELYMS